jgi:dihydrofolate reductase
VSMVKVSAFSVSLDGFGAGPNQDLNNPLGVGGFGLHAWFMKTAAFAAMHQLAGGSQGVDDDFAARSFDNVGAWILGRNMFGPIRGPWEDDSWTGWWGEEPPYHVPVFRTHPLCPVALAHERRH